MDQEFEEMFEDLAKSRDEKPYDYAESIIAKIEDEYKNMPSVDVERKKEREGLIKKITELTKSLNKCKNVKNHRKTQINQTLAEKRKKIKTEIEKVKDALHQISVEEKGANVSSQRLVDATLANK